MDYETWRMVSGSVGLVIFVTLFAGVLVYALWPKNKAKFDHAANMPLDDDPVQKPAMTRGGCRG